MANEVDPTSATTLDAGSDEAAHDDSFDEILKKVVRGSGAIPELSRGTVVAERFTIERALGSGGMGTVYLAKDHSLAREVAIKVHHAAGGAVRLRREAIAMAKLAHPNVVTVFEVGVLDRHPFVVMEYVTGSTLRAWLASPRTVAEILDVMIAAGSGLAAAHDAGLVHRDFKPENVFVAADGRARVGDFGLAREHTSQEEPAPAVDAAQPFSSSLTQTGAVLGTPAYMAPEQLAGAPVDARADQFAFCITLWEALWRERPFEGATFAELATAVKTGARRPPPPSPKVPARVRAVLERGLSPAAGDRFPSMHALIEALRPPRRGRRVAIALVATGVAIGGGAFALMSAKHARVSCDDAGASLLAQVPTDLAAQLRAAHLDDAAARVEGALDLFTTDLRTRAHHACEAGRAAHDWTPAVLAKSESCLEIATLQTRALLAGDVDAAHAPDLVRAATTLLPPLDSCDDVTYLATMPDVPVEPAALRAYIKARADLAIALSELDHGNRGRADEALDRVRASTVRDATITAGLTLAEGMRATERDDVLAAEKLLTDAYYAARTVDDDVLTTTALGALLSVSVEHPEDPQAITWRRTALADAERVAKRSPWLAGRLYLATARLADAQGDSPAALADIARARAVLPPTDPAIAQTWVVEGAVQLWSGHVDEGVALYEKAIAFETAHLGADHPMVGSVLGDYAAGLLDAGRTKEAAEAADRAMKVLTASGTRSDRLLDSMRVNLAAVLSDSGREDQAVPLLELARTHYVAGHGLHSAYVANVDMNLAIIYMARPDQLAKAAAMLDEALATDEQLFGADHPQVADVLYNVAVVRNKQGDAAGALAAMKRCLAIYGAKAPGSDRHRLSLAMVAVYQNLTGDHAGALATTDTALAFTTPAQGVQPAAMAMLERARALIALHRPSEARPLLVEARAAYVTVGMPARIDEVDRLAADAHLALR